MCINPTKGRFTVDRNGKCFIFTNNMYAEKVLLCFPFLIVNYMLTCRPFRNFWKASECSGEASKTKTAGSNEVKVRWTIS